MLDIGLMQCLCQVPGDEALRQDDLLAIYRGRLAEQFVAQELTAAGHTDLHYWSREARNSSAEVDYLAAREGRICPIEVKNGPSGRLRSLLLLLTTFPDCKPGYVLSSAPYGESAEHNLVFLPLYYAGSLRP